VQGADVPLGCPATHEAIFASVKRQRETQVAQALVPELALEHVIEVVRLGSAS